MNRKYCKTLAIIYDYPLYKSNRRKRVGSIITEIKNDEGTIYITIKNGEKNTFYNIYVINSKNEYIKFESINTTLNGYAEKILKFNPDNFFMTNLCVEKTSGMIFKNNPNEIKMIAIMNKSNVTTDELKEISKKPPEKNRRNDNMNKKTGKEYHNKTNIVSSNNTVANTTSCNNKAPNNISHNNTTQKNQEDTFIEIAKKFRNEMAEIEKTGILTLEELENIKNISKMKTEKFLKEQSQDLNICENKNEICEQNKTCKNNEYTINECKNKDCDISELKNKDCKNNECQNNDKTNKDSTCNEKKHNDHINTGSIAKPEIDMLFSKYKNFVPFLNDNKTKWIKIGIKELSLLPLDCHKLLNCTLILHSYKKYKYLLLGKQDNKLLLGVPGIFNPEDKIYMNKFGTCNFKPYNKVDVRNGIFGYYIFICKA